MKLQNALSYISSELHGSVGPLFNPTISEEVNKFFIERTNTKLKYIESTLIGKNKFIVGDSLTVADCYCYIVLSWMPYLKVDLAPYPNVSAYFNKIKELPNVKAAHEKMATNPKSIV